MPMTAAAETKGPSVRTAPRQRQREIVPCSLRMTEYLDFAHAFRRGSGRALPDVTDLAARQLCGRRTPLYCRREPQRCQITLLYPHRLIAAGIFRVAATPAWAGLVDVVG
jgi:hypothetical protein